MTICIRLSDIDGRLIRKIAELKEITMSEYVRDAIQSQLDKEYAAFVKSYEEESDEW